MHGFQVSFPVMLEMKIAVRIIQLQDFARKTNRWFQIEIFYSAAFFIQSFSGIFDLKNDFEGEFTEFNFLLPRELLRIKNLKQFV